MLYKSYAAYALALLRKDFVSIRQGDDICFGLNKDGVPVISWMTVEKFSLLGALRYAKEDIGGSLRVYNTVYGLIVKLAREWYDKSIYELDHAETLNILRGIVNENS